MATPSYQYIYCLFFSHLVDKIADEINISEPNINNPRHWARIVAEGSIKHGRFEEYFFDLNFVFFDKDISRE